MCVVEVKLSDSQSHSCLNTCSIPFVDGTVVAARSGGAELLALAGLTGGECKGAAS